MILRSLLLAATLGLAVFAHAGQVVITEIQYNPHAPKTEYLEVTNLTNTPIDIARWAFTSGITYTFPEFNPGSPQTHLLGPRERIVVSAAAEGATRTTYSIPANVRIFGPWSGSLSNDGETVTLTDKNGTSVCTVDYKDGGRWPKAADGAGHSIVLRNENNDPDSFHNWRQSNLLHGTPGTEEVAIAPSVVRISEAHFNASGNLDWVELENTGSSAASLAGLFITSKVNGSDKQALAGFIGNKSFTSFDVAAPFDGATGKVTLYLTDTPGNVLGVAELTRVAGRNVMQAIYPPTWPAIPAHEYVKNYAEWYASVSDTRNAANAPTRTESIVINEIMYDPPDNSGVGEFVEFYNRGSETVDFTGWKVRGGIDFDFAAGTSIPAGGYLVLATEVALVQQNHPGLAVVGPWTSKLGNKGDLIRLVDAFNNLADEVDYESGGDWPTLAGGRGSSLELIHPDLDNSRASAWRDSDESKKSAFQTFAVTGTYRQLKSLGTVRDDHELHLNLVGDSHILLRNIQLRQNNAGSNLLSNAARLTTNGTGATGWLCQGTHWASYFSGADFHLIADGHGDERANRAELDATALTVGRTYTLEFQARWISGRNKVIAQTWDRSLGDVFAIPYPKDLGTPGGANTARATTPTPQVDSILHRPAVPAPGVPVKITARVASLPALAEVNVWHRLDSTNAAAPWTTTPMRDDGTGGDEIPGDGLYTATLDQYPFASQLAQFYVRASTATGSSQLPRLGAAQPALFLIDDSPFDSRLRRQRFLVSSDGRAGLTTATGESAAYHYDFPRLSNHYFNATFIHNETDVYYGAEIRKSGSPFTRSNTAELTRGQWKLPEDRLFRLHEKFSFDDDPSLSRTHHNRLIRYWLYVLGHPVSENEFVFHRINGEPSILLEDTEPVDDELLDRAFPDGNSAGTLLSIDDEWWMRDDWTPEYRDADWSYRGSDNPIRYHAAFGARSREVFYDYQPFIDFTKAVSNADGVDATAYRTRLEPQLDLDGLLRVAAVRGFADDWDSFTLERGKNGYFYRAPAPSNRWTFLHWDSDQAFEDANDPVLQTTRPGWGTFIQQPWVRRVFNYWLEETLKLTTGTNSARTSAWFDAEEAASSAYTVNRSFYEAFMTARRPVVETIINAAEGTGGTSDALSAPFAVTAPAAGSSTSAAPVIFTGTAPATAYSVSIDGQAAAVFSWLNQTTWELRVALPLGGHSLTFRMKDATGATLATLTHNIVRENGDADEDGLFDTEEAAAGTSSLLTDTDGDGYSDGLEVALGSSPILSTSVPAGKFIAAKDAGAALDGIARAAYLGGTFTSAASGENLILPQSFELATRELTNRQWAAVLQYARVNFPELVVTWNGSVGQAIYRGQVVCNLPTATAPDLGAAEVTLDARGQSFLADNALTDRPARGLTWYGAYLATVVLNHRANQSAILLPAEWDYDLSETGWRLPTDGEWEWAARGTTEARVFPTGPIIATNQANYAGVIGRTIPVGSYPADVSGVRDLAGNVSEWTWNLFIDSGFAESTVRGGSYADAEALTSNASRVRSARNAIRSDSGVRLAFNTTLLNPATLSIATQPAARIVSPAGTFTLSVVAGGAKAPQATYQWFKDGKALSGRTASTLEDTFATVADAGLYTVRLSAPGTRTITSAPAAVWILDTTPDIRTFAPNATAQLAPPLTGPAAGLTFAWSKDGDAARDSSKVSGSHSRILTIRGIVRPSDEGDYLCTINGAGAPAFATITLRIARPPELLTQALANSIVAGSFYHATGFATDDSRKAPTRYSVSGLPAGLKFNSATGEITGRPSRPGTYHLTFTVSNLAGSATKAAELVVAALPDNVVGTYVGLVNLGSFDARLDLTTTGAGSFSGRLTGEKQTGIPVSGPAVTDAGPWSFTGALDADALLNGSPDLVTAKITIKYKSPIAPLVLNVTLDPATNLLSGTVEGATPPAPVVLQGWRNVWTKTNPATAHAGTHNFATRLSVPQLGDLAIPQGACFGSIAVTASNGAVTLSSRVADDSAFTIKVGTSILGPQGQVLLFRTTSLQSLRGILNVAANTHIVSGSAKWTKVAQLGSRSYAAGFDTPLTVFGGLWTAVAAPDYILGLTALDHEAHLDFSEANLGTSMTNPDVTFPLVSAPAEATVPTLASGNNPGDTTFSYRSNGLFYGTFKLTDPAPSGRSIAYRGLVVRSEDGEPRGYGFFHLPQGAAGSDLLSGHLLLEKAP
jgi:formylglycine-generating enzyme required for sulfatase activity